MNLTDGALSELVRLSELQHNNASSCQRVSSDGMKRSIVAANPCEDLAKTLVLLRSECRQHSGSYREKCASGDLSCILR